MTVRHDLNERLRFILISLIFVSLSAPANADHAPTFDVHSTAPCRDTVQRGEQSLSIDDTLILAQGSRRTLSPPMGARTPERGKAVGGGGREGYVNGYRHVPNAAISGHNRKQLKEVDVQDCIAACNQEAWCKSFDYYKKDRACDLSDTNARDVGGLKANYSGNPYDHYEKQR